MGESTQTAELVELLKSAVPPGTVLEGSEGISAIAEMLEEYASPDFVTVMVSKEGEASEHPGVDGFTGALSDWISPYERFRLEIDEAITLEDRILYLARQVGTTKHDGVEIETPSATLWLLTEGRIAQATFYMDQKMALGAGGIEPGSG